MTSVNPFPVGAFSNAGQSPATAASTQLMALGLLNSAGAVVATESDAVGRLAIASEDVLKSALIELRVIAQVLALTLGLNEDLDAKRNDELQALSADVM